MRLFFWVALIALLSSTMGFASTIPASTVTVASPITVADTVVADSDVVNTATLDYNGGFSYNTKIKIKVVDAVTGKRVALADFGNMRVMNAGMVSIACIPGTVCLPEQANLLVQKGFNAQIVVATVGTPASVFGSTITVQQINPATGSVSLVVKKTIVK